MFEALSERLEGILKKLRGRGFLKEEDIVSALKEIKIALLEADVRFYRKGQGKGYWQRSD